MGRHLGQHFLHDPAILDRIVQALNPSTTDLVLEIGAGQGTLTRRLARQVGRVVAIEKDTTLATAANGVVERDPLPSNVQLVFGDALSIDWHELISDAIGHDSTPNPDFKIVGNVPYYITAPLIEKALQTPFPQVAVYLIQREVAERLAAEPGGKVYGALSVGVQVVAKVERLFVVRPGSFSPPPAVDSAVVRLTPLDVPLVAEFERSDFRRFVGAIFGQRRKQLSRALRTVTGADKQQSDSILRHLDIDPSVRPEVLAPPQMLRLFRAIDQQDSEEKTH